METKYKFEVRAKHLQPSSSAENSHAKQSKTKKRLNENSLPDFVTSQVSCCKKFAEIYFKI